MRTAQRREDRTPVSAVPTTDEIGIVKQVWEGTWPGDGRKIGEPITSEQLAALPAGQLEARWLDSQTAGVYRHDELVCLLPVIREATSYRTFVRPGGNTKTRNVFGIINSCSHGCLRAATGYSNCKSPCYSDESGRGGCYAATGPWQIRTENQEQEYDIVSNGLSNGLLRLYLPNDGDASLTRQARCSGCPSTPRWRVASESSDGSLAVSLGILQQWAEANPTHLFQVISSDHFRPSNAMLSWLAQLPNVWVGHSVSAWHGEDELDSRFAAIERHIEFGIPTAIWIATDADWDNQPVLERALELVLPEHIIEAPHQTSKHAKDHPLLNVNPLGSCGDRRYDRNGRLVTLRPTADGPRPFVRRGGKWVAAKLPIHPRCRGCRLLCGQHVLGTTGGA